MDTETGRERPRVHPAVPAPPVPAGGGDLRVGVDLVRVADVRDSLDRFGERYLARVFTEDERAYAMAASPDVAARRLAARFAAKEAVIKVLRPQDAPAWTSVEIVRRGDGSCEVRLHGRAAQLAQDAGLGPVAVSLSHEDEYAAASAAAWCAGGSGAERPAEGCAREGGS